MSMPSDVTGRLVMTKDSGEQSSFSTPFIDEFDHISNRYYQYFELVVLSKSSSFDPDIDNCIFHVYLKNKDYTEMDNNFEKGLDLKFGYLSNSLNEVLSCTYKNYEKSYTDNNVAQLGDYIGRNSNNSNCDIISFLIYPETCDDETFVDEYNVFDDIYYHELLVFLNGTLIAKNIKIPDTLMSNFSIGCTIEEDISNNFSYQWNFSNDRFIYMDLAYQCYEEITTKNMSDYRYFPLYRLNHTHESDDKYDLIMLPYVNFSNSDIKKFGIEVTMRIPDATKLDELFEGVGQYDNLILFRIILAPVKANHRYLYSKYLDTPISYTDADLLDEKLGIQVSGSISYNRNVYEMGIRDINGSNLTTISYPTSKTNYNIFSFRYDSDSTSYIGTVYNYADMPENYIESNAGNISNTENFIPEINNIIIQKVKYLDLDINLGTKPFKVYFTKFGETKGTNYVSPYNTYWKSLFYTSRTYPFTNPLKNNPIFIPYIFNDYENNNMYMEVTFGTNANVTYYCYIGSGFSITTNDDPDTKTVNMLNGYVIVYKGNGTYTLYRYNNGVQSTIIGNMDVGTDNTTFYFKSLIDPKEENIYSEIGYDSIASTIPSSDQSKFYTVCIHAISDNNASDMGSITINFGPDGYVYQDKVDDLWEYDEFDKLFTTDIDSNFDYAQGDTSDLDDQSDYTIDGQLNIGNIQVDEDDPNYIIDGTLEYVSQFEITDVVISPNTFETDIGESKDLSFNIIVTFDRIETFFDDEGNFVGSLAVTALNENGEPTDDSFSVTSEAIYVSHETNTITFTVNGHFDAGTNLPGDYLYGLLIDATDQFTQNDEYNSEKSITITYHIKYRDKKLEIDYDTFIGNDFRGSLLSLNYKNDNDSPEGKYEFYPLYKITNNYNDKSSFVENFIDEDGNFVGTIKSFYAYYWNDGNKIELTDPSNIKFYDYGNSSLRFYANFPYYSFNQNPDYIIHGYLEDRYGDGSNLDLGAYAYVYNSKMELIDKFGNSLLAYTMGYSAPEDYGYRSYSIDDIYWSNGSTWDYNIRQDQIILYRSNGSIQNIKLNITIMHSYRVGGALHSSIQNEVDDFVKRFNSFFNSLNIKPIIEIGDSYIFKTTDDYITKDNDAYMNIPDGISVTLNNNSKNLFNFNFDIETSINLDNYPNTDNSEFIEIDFVPKLRISFYLSDDKYQSNYARFEYVFYSEYSHLFGNGTRDVLWDHLYGDDHYEKLPSIKIKIY